MDIYDAKKYISLSHDCASLMKPTKIQFVINNTSLAVINENIKSL